MKYMNFTNKNGQPIRNNTNNAILNTLGAMPMKDGISDSTSNFSINRHKYFNTFNTNNQTHFQYLHNKFIGGNTDSSSIISKNKSYAVSAISNYTVVKYNESEVTENPAEADRYYSSVYGNDSKGTGHARSMLDSEQAWSVGPNTVGQWMTIDLGSVKTVIGVTTQGRVRSNQWVTSYKLYYSNNNTNFYVIDGGKAFAGNTDNNSKITNRLNTRIKARYIKFYVLTWNNYISMRAGVVVSVSSFPEDKKPTSLVNTKNINIIDSALRRARGSVSK